MNLKVKSQFDFHVFLVINQPLFKGNSAYESLGWEYVLQPSLLVEHGLYSECVPCRYDPKTNQWSSDVAPTSTCRTSVGVAVLGGFLYAVGGQDGVSCLNIVER